MAADDDERDELRRSARDAAVRSMTANIVAVAFQLGLVIAFTKRDWFGRQWARYRWYVLREWRGVEQRRLIAELRRDISRIEHGSG
jgi:hypothetical protein